MSQLVDGPSKSSRFQNQKAGTINKFIIICFQRTGKNPYQKFTISVRKCNFCFSKLISIQNHSFSDLAPNPFWNLEQTGLISILLSIEFLVGMLFSLVCFLSCPNTNEFWDSPGLSRPWNALTLPFDLILFRDGKFTLCSLLHQPHRGLAVGSCPGFQLFLYIET